MLLGCLILLGAANLPAQPPANSGPPPETPEQLAHREKLQAQYDAAKAKGDTGDWDGAIAECDQLLTAPERTPQIQLLRATALTLQSTAHFKKGRYLQAIDCAYLGTLEKSDYLPAHRARATAYIARGDYDKAINTANRMIGIDGTDANAYSMRGHAYACKSNFDQSIADQTKALELNPNLADAFQRRAFAHLSKKDFAKTIADVDQALRLDAKHVDALCDRGFLYAANKNVSAALADFNAALAIDPNHARAHLLKGRTLLTQGKKEEAKQYFDKAVELSPLSESYLARAQFRQEIKMHAEAVEDYSKAIELNSKLLSAYQGRTACCNKTGNTEFDAIDREKIRELTPKTSDKKPSKDKKDPPSVDPGLARRFIVQSKEVDPAQRAAVIASAARIDKMVEQNYKKYNVQPNPKTTDEQFVRRIYLDITGTIPTLKQVNAFLDSKEPNKRLDLIDSLLNSEGYASHQFNYWADALRYKDDLNNSVRGELFRQFLKQSLGENKPWNKLVYEMISAEGRIWENPATGYLQRDPGMPLDVMNNTLRIFIGTRIGCAQCHNHPFDKWTQKDFYHMAAFTFGTNNSTHGGEKRFFVNNPTERLRKEFEAIVQEEEDRRNNSYRFDRLIGINMMAVHDDATRAIPLPKDYAYDDGKPGDPIPPKTLLGQPAEVKKDEPPRRAFARWLVSKDNPRFALTISNRLWKQLFGRGQFEPIDDITDQTVAENPELMKYLESEMVRLNFNMKEFLRILTHTETYQRQAHMELLLPGQDYHFPGPILRRMTAEQAWDSFVTLAVEKDIYREPKASLKGAVQRFNFNKITAQEVLESEQKGNEVDRINNEFRGKFLFKGELIARASELPSPVPPNHFLRMFGQSDRELISASSTDGSVPQILFMLNGPISHMLLEKNSTIYNNIMRKNSIPEGVRSAFLTCLSREPDREEMARAIQEVKDKGAAGYGNVVWSLVNTREFLFIQ
jgi:tetratricopeptide (TPR) repeat protein